MSQVDNRCYDPETIEMLRTVLDEAWASLPADKQARTTKSILAERVLRHAAIGVRDPERLRAAALNGIDGAAS